VKLYHPQTGQGKDVPAIDAPAWISIHGYLTEPPAPIDAAPAPALAPPAPAAPALSAESAILAFINAAQHLYELEPIPTVGKAAAKAILDNRPEGGYTSLDELAPILPRQSSLEAIRSWTAEV
jgi:hypothetical protein